MKQRRQIKGEFLNDTNFIDGYEFYVSKDNYLKCKYCNITAKIIKKEIVNGRVEVTYEYKGVYEDKEKEGKIKHNHRRNMDDYYIAKLYEELKEIGIYGLKRKVTLKETTIDILNKYKELTSPNVVPSIKTCINYILIIRKESVTKELSGINMKDYLVGKTDKVTVFADKTAYNFFRESDTLFCDGTFEKKRFELYYTAAKFCR